jgi:hypothetical protein
MRSPQFALLLGMVALVSLAPPVWADPFVEFFRQQKIGQELKVQGPFRRNSQQREVFKKDDKTGKVEYYTFFAMVVLPTHLIGNGSLTQEARGLDVLVVFYPDENMVKDLPVEGDKVWFTGTLLGYQFGDGITTGAGIGGYPYILLKSVEPEASIPSP